jgi:type IV secretion system protein VirB5
MSIKTPDNPYLAARQEWNERYGSFVSQARIWQVIGLGSLAVAALAVFYALYLGSQSKVLPYIVEVDRLGNTQGAGFARSVQYTEDRVIEASLAQFVSYWRSVTVDGRVQKDRIDRLYSFLSRSDPAVTKLNKHFREDGFDPFDRARTGTVSVGINGINRISDSTYQVDWTELNFDRNGVEKARARFRVVLNTTIIPPTTDVMIQRNPVGLYVTDLDWTEVSS